MRGDAFGQPNRDQQESGQRRQTRAVNQHQREYAVADHDGPYSRKTTMAQAAAQHPTGRPHGCDRHRGACDHREKLSQFVMMTWR